MQQQQAEPLYVLRGHRAAVQCTAFSPSCNTLAAGDAEGELKLWDLSNRRITTSIRAHETHSGILQVAFTNIDGCGALISQGRDNTVKCWQLQGDGTVAREPLQVLAAGSYNFCRFALLQPGQTSSSCCRCINDTTASSTTPSSTMQAGTSSTGYQVVQGFNIADAPILAAADAGNSEHHLQQQQQWQQRQHHAGAPGLLLQQLQLPQHVHGLDLPAQVAQESVSASCTKTTADMLGGLDLTEDVEEQLVHRQGVGGNSSVAGIAGANSSRPGVQRCCASSAAQEATAAAATADTAGWQAGANVSSNCFLALPSVDAADIGIWQLWQSGNEASGPAASRAGSIRQRPHVLLRQPRSGDKPIHGVCMALVLLQSQGSHLHVLAGYEDGTIALWDCRQPKTHLTSQRLHTEAVMCLAVAADCKTGFSGSADDSLTAFNVNVTNSTISITKQLQLPKPGIADVAVRPDGRIAASGGWDGKVRIWHCRKKRPLALLRWHSQQVACVTFSSDNRLLAAGGRDGHVTMWSIYPPDE